MLGESLLVRVLAKACCFTTQHVGGLVKEREPSSHGEPWRCIPRLQSRHKSGRNPVPRVYKRLVSTTFIYIRTQFSCKRVNTIELPQSNCSRIKVLANEDTLLRTHCCRHKCFPVCPARATFVADTNLVSGTQKMFLILVRNILCP